MATEIRTIEADGTAILKDGSVWHRGDTAAMSQYMSHVQMAAPSRPSPELEALSLEGRISQRLGASLLAALGRTHPGMSLTEWLRKFFNGDESALDKELGLLKTAGVQLSLMTPKAATAGLIALENHWR